MSTYRTPICRNPNHGNAKHGKAKSRLYACWWDMHRRCKSDQPKYAKYYKSRGVTVCEDWATFEGFEGWAITAGYQDHLELDRKDNDKGYSPDNCRWATRSEQVRNTRKRPLQKGKPPSSKYKGVSLQKTSMKWIAGIVYDGKRHHIGIYKDEIEAAKAYDREAKIRHGGVLVLNFPDE